MLPFHLKLADGTPILIRLVQPDDRPHFVSGIRRMSMETRFHRFNSAMIGPSDTQLDYLTRVDQHDHIAICAIDESGPEPAGVGVARCVRCRLRPDEAEIAVTVVDGFQGRGLGTILVAALNGVAAQHGIHTFVAYVNAERRGFLDFLSVLGSHIDGVDSGIAEIRFDVRDSAQEIPDTPSGRLFRQALSMAA